MRNGHANRGRLHDLAALPVVVLQRCHRELLRIRIQNEFQSADVAAVLRPNARPLLRVPVADLFLAGGALPRHGRGF